MRVRGIEVALGLYDNAEIAQDDAFESRMTELARDRQRRFELRARLVIASLVVMQ